LSLLFLVSDLSFPLSNGFGHSTTTNRSIITNIDSKLNHLHQQLSPKKPTKKKRNNRTEQI